MKKVVDNYNIDMSSNNVILFGEWCGTGIQKGVFGAADAAEVE